MPVLTIRQQSDPVLRQVAAECDAQAPEIQQLAKDMIETLAAARGVGLAAPQVGQSVRLIVISFGKHGPQSAFVNPVIVKRKGEQRSTEGCLSVGGGKRYCQIKRSMVVWMEFTDIATVSRQTMKLKGLMAACAQHEIDHLDGKLITDYA